jgi:hypothetical protein
MKKALPVLCALSLAVTQAYAGEFTTEPAATAYWQIPLSVSQTGKQRQAFGLRLDQSVRDNTGNLISSFSAPLRPAVVDFRFNDKGVKGIYVHGVNTISPTMMQLFDNISTEGLIVGGVVVAATTLAIVSAVDNGGTGGEGGAPIPSFAQSNRGFDRF